MTGQDKTNLRCFQGDSPVSHSHVSDSNGDLQTPVTSGRNCAASLRNCGSIMCLAKMLLTSSIWGSTKRSLTGKRRDMQSGHSYFLLAPSVRGMSGSELSSWGLMFPTPLASDTGTRAAVPRAAVPRVEMTPRGAFRGMRKNGGKWAAGLSEVIYFLEEGADAAMRINPEWAEWMMGFPKGWTGNVSGA